MSRRTLWLLTSLTVATLLLLGSVGSASAHHTACPSPNSPNELVLAGGSGQTAQLGNLFPASLQAQLANSNGCPVTGNLAGVNVEFDAPASGPSGLFTSSGSRVTTAGTDSQGVATAPTFTANDLAGSYTVAAHSDYGSVEFSLSNTASGLAAAINASSGSGQAATAYGEYAQPLQARVTDASGNPVQGSSVTFSVVTGPTGAGASFLGSGQATATTNANGVATSPPLVANGSPGRFSAVASADGLPSVATYTLDNHAATSTLAAVKGAAQSATIDTEYSSPLAVRLLDSTGQPIEGGAVTFTLGVPESGRAAAAIAPGATFNGGTTQATALTDADGIATSPVFTANGATGIFRATATVNGSAPISFTLRNLSARIILSMRSQGTVVDTRFRAPLSGSVRESRGGPIRGVGVVFTVLPGSSASADFPDGSRQATVVTGANGKAIAPHLVANTKAGIFTVTARIAGSGDVVKARLQNVAARAAAITIGVASGESTACSSAFPVPLAVTVFDRYGNRVAGARVMFTAPSRGATGYFTVGHHRGSSLRTPSVTATTSANGIAVAPRFTANQYVGGYLVRTTVKGSSAHGSFALVNAPRP